MDLNDYFEPVALDKPEGSLRISDAMLGHNIRINTPNTPIDEISNYQLAIMGVAEDRNSVNTGSAMAADHIRASLYELFRVNDKLRIIDLGNLRQAATVSDTYFGIRDVMTDLLNNQVTAIVLGGTQDITHALYMAFEQQAGKVNMVTVDARIDLDEGAVSSFSWMQPVMRSPKLFRCTCLGNQQYLVDRKHQEYLEERGFDNIRLGALRSNISLTEPLLRDAHLVSFDIAAVKQSEAPATRYPSPNGLAAEEACQLARYAGLSDQVSCFGLFEINPEYDLHGQTARLAAQSIWYFMEGFSQRKREKPSQNNPDFKVFLVNHQDMEYALTFYKSVMTGRWWMEIPELKTGGQVVVACSQEEYQQACSHDIPEMWWKAFQRIN
ncbi:MAG TPA: formimidoylglutamase [Bacteroidales bacterium]|nr:formimidoylglutamase [Bacteroidales bacterium]